jgi:hypothetical protein
VIISIDVPDTVAPDAVEALCAAGDYKPSDGAKGAFAKTVLIRYIKQVTTNWRVATAVNTAKATATAQATTDLSGVA